MISSSLSSHSLGTRDSRREREVEGQTLLFNENKFEMSFLFLIRDEILVLEVLHFFYVFFFKYD